MAVRSAINQKVQIGPEITPGSAVACTKLLSAFMWTLGEKATTKQFRGTGRQYPSASALLTEMSSGKLTGPGDFAELVYICSGLWGSGSPTLHSPSTTAYDWTWTPGITGSYAANAKTFTLQVGDGVDAEQYAYLAFTGMDYKITRKQEVTFGAEFMAQIFSDGATLTSSPTAVEQAPMTGAQFNLYLDTTSSGIGTTQLTDPMEIAFKASGYYDPYWPINRANASYAGLVDKEKKHELTLTLQANSAGIAVRGNYLQTGARCYVRVQGTGQIIDGTNSISATMAHDMACFVSDMKEFGPTEDVYSVTYTLQVAEDTAWNSGEAQKMTLTNLVAAL
jgi:hypothetical protein